MVQMNVTGLENKRMDPVWVHFGEGSILHAFIARLQQDLLQRGKTGRDFVTMLVNQLSDGSMEKQTVVAAAKGLQTGCPSPTDMQQLISLFRNPKLQTVSLAIPEEIYALQDPQGNFLPSIEADLKNGPENCSHAVCILVALLFQRFKGCGTPISVVSIDSFPRNGEALRRAVVIIAREWRRRGFVTVGFMAWLTDVRNVSFPNSMVN